MVSTGPTRLMQSYAEKRPECDKVLREGQSERERSLSEKRDLRLGFQWGTGISVPVKGNRRGKGSEMVISLPCSRTHAQLHMLTCTLAHVHRHAHARVRAHTHKRWHKLTAGVTSRRRRRVNGRPLYCPQLSLHPGDTASDAGSFLFFFF